MELKSCPFCGDDEIYISTLEDGTRLMCRSERCNVSVQTYTKNTVAEAIAAWNRRPNSSSPDGRMREALEKIASGEGFAYVSADEKLDHVRKFARAALSPNSEPVHNPDSPKPL